MFKDTSKSVISPKNFGVGSLIRVQSPERSWLVVASTTTAILLVDLSTFELSKKCAVVEDCNHLTENEARMVVSLTDIGYTFSDFDLEAKGMK